MPVELSNLLLSTICALLIVIWWSLRSWMGRVDTRLDRMEAKQAQQEKECVTWADHEALKLIVNGVDRRVTIIETTCKAEHGK